jgi:ADP-heptose:LPS heptosyltransferase
MTSAGRTIAVELKCAGMGDCLCAIPILRKLRRQYPEITSLVLFTHEPGLFRHCPYVNHAFPIGDTTARQAFREVITLFETAKLPYHLMDTIDFMSIPAGFGQLSFREKQLEYFPGEEDRAGGYDVVLNTSMTWPSRSWALENWQRLADELLQAGCSVAVVGKDVTSPWDGLTKTSRGLRGAVDLTNRLSLDQTYFTIAKAGLFVTCQNGLSVLSGATGTEVIVLDRSIEWSKYALYRREDPHWRFTLVKGNCDIYCCDGEACPVYGEFRCIPGYPAVRDAVFAKRPPVRA